MAATSTVTTLYVMLYLLAASSTRAAYESAGCSDQGCGIPCYMRPAADSCHYKPYSPCSNEGYDIDLENLILNLNSSLHRLENKLVQKRVSKSKQYAIGDEDDNEIFKWSLHESDRAWHGHVNANHHHGHTIEISYSYQIRCRDR